MCLCVCACVCVCVQLLEEGSIDADSELESDFDEGLDENEQILSFRKSETYKIDDDEEDIEAEEVLNSI